MKAICLSGGGSKGAFQSGAIKYLISDLKNQYDIISGVSVGAINAAFLSMYKKGEEKQASKKLENLWLSLENKKIYKHWRYFPYIAAIWKMSVFDSSPLQQLLRSNLSLKKIQESGKKISVGAVSLNTGHYVVFDQNNPNFIDAVCASSSYPSMFLPVKIDNGNGEEYFIDGGPKTISPIKEAITMGATHIDIICTSPVKRSYLHIETPNILNIFKRSLDVSTDKILSNDLEKLDSYNQLAAAGIGNKKYITYNIIRPDDSLLYNSLDFDPDEIRRMIVLGYNKAKEVMESKNA